MQKLLPSPCTHHPTDVLQILGPTASHANPDTAGNPTVQMDRADVACLPLERNSSGLDLSSQSHIREFVFQCGLESRSSDDKNLSCAKTAIRCSTPTLSRSNFLRRRSAPLSAIRHSPPHARPYSLDDHREGANWIEMEPAGLC